MKKVALTHTVLYAKNWYKITNLVEDLKQTLKADGYNPSNEREIALILVARLEDAEHHRIGAFDLLNALGNKSALRNLYGDVDYNHNHLVIDYCIELLMSLNNDQWHKSKPNYKLVLPKK